MSQNGTTSQLTIEWAMARLEAEWTIRPEHKQAKGEALERFLRQVGEHSFRTAIIRCVDEHAIKFCPSINEIRSYASPSMREHKDAHRCDICIDGWCYTERDEYDNRQVVRCPNWRTQYGQ